MITCPICNKELEDSCLFCESCGAKIVPIETPSDPKAFCPACGKELESDAPFCTFCGADLVPKKASPKAKTAKKPFPKRLVFAGIAAVLALALLFTLISCIFSCGTVEDVNSIVYFKGNELHLVDAGDVEDHWQISDSLGFGGVGFGYVQMSTDGSKIFFPDKQTMYTDNYSGFTLYYRDTTDPDSEAVKIANDVWEYYITDDGEFLIYQSNGAWYWHDLETKTKIANDCYIDSNCCSDDLKTVLFKSSNGISYRKVYGDDEKTKIDSDITSFAYVSEDAETLYYVKDNNLYLKEGDDDKVKIDSDISFVFVRYEGEKLYYVKGAESEAGGFDDAGQNAILYYYSDGESVEVSRDYNIMGDLATDAPVITFKHYTDDEDEYDLYIVNDGVCFEVDVENIFRYFISVDGETLYYICDVNEAGTEGELYKATIGESALEDVELYDSNVSTKVALTLAGDDVLYGKNYNEESRSYELFVNQESVSEDVYDVDYASDADLVYVTTDYNNQKSSGTLNILDGSDLEKVYDDVYFGSFDHFGSSVVVLDSGDMFFLADYNRDMNYGELFFYDGGEAEFVDDEVGFLIPLNHESKN